MVFENAHFSVTYHGCHKGCPNAGLTGAPQCRWSTNRAGTETRPYEIMPLDNQATLAYAARLLLGPDRANSDGFFSVPCPIWELEKKPGLNAYPGVLVIDTYRIWC